MLEIIGRIALFFLGQKLVPGEDSKYLKRGLIVPVVLTVLAIVFFVQGLAALLIAGWFALTELAGWSGYYSALAVSGFAFFLCLVIALKARCAIGKACEKDRSGLSGITSSIKEVDPRSLVSAFLDGFAKGGRDCKVSEGEKRHCKK